MSGRLSDVGIAPFASATGRGCGLCVGDGGVGGYAADVARTTAPAAAFGEVAVDVERSVDLEDGPIEFCELDSGGVRIIGREDGVEQEPELTFKLLRVL